jgi:hypothetical protein
MLYQLSYIGTKERSWHHNTKSAFLKSKRKARREDGLGEKCSAERRCYFSESFLRKNEVAFDAMYGTYGIAV